MEQKAQKVADIRKVIANKNRLMILCILEDGMRTVREHSCFQEKYKSEVVNQHR